MRELETQQGEGEIGRCRICGQTFSTEENLWEHLFTAAWSRPSPPAQTMQPTTSFE